MIEVSVLVPTADNGGAAFPVTVYDAFGLFLATEFGGFTRMTGTAAGGWYDPKTGNYYPDEHFVYVVSLSSITEGGKVRTLADTVKSQFGQLAVYVRYLTLSEVL